MRKAGFIFVVILIFGAIFIALKFYFPSQFPKLSDLRTQLEEINREIIAPPPLRASKESDTSFLTRAGIIKWTNVQRKGNGGLVPLTENTKLNIVASLRAKDMFEKQYFAHESPDGKDAGHLVDNSGYEYIMIGENIALGNFGDDQELVQAWMDSPGHRANILNSRFRDIGVAALRGIFEGKSTWIAVQVFGRPTSACPRADAAMKSRIELNEIKINELRATLDSLRADIESMSSRHSQEYNWKIEEYNNLVNQYNEMITVTKNLVDQYNSQVRISNQCIEGG